jgi:hypothetical protein
MNRSPLTEYLMKDIGVVLRIYAEAYSDFQCLLEMYIIYFNAQI